MNYELPTISRSSCFENSLSKGGSQSYLSMNLNSPRQSFNLRRFAMVNNATRVHFDEIKRKSLNDTDTIRPSVKVHSIFEPLKIRTITSEPASEFVIKPIQKWLWQSLGKFNIFPLTHGRDVTEVLNDFKNEKNLPLLISGDYTAATDNLNRELIKEVVFNLLPKIPVIYHQKFLKNSGLHFLHYKDGAVVDQTNGQLMGSLTSFPILCLVNYISYLLTTDLTDGVSSECRINGDDIFFYANEEGYSIWKTIVSQFGLTPSFGKNYSSPTHCTINSQWFVHKNNLDGKTKFPFRKIGFVNYALLKKGTVSTEDQKKSNYIPDILPSLLDTFLKQGQVNNGKRTNKSKLLRLFKYRHFDLIKKSGRDLLVPIHFGGLYPYLDTSRNCINKRINTVRGRACYFANKSGVFKDHIKTQLSKTYGEGINGYVNSPDDKGTEKFLLAGGLSLIEKYDIPKRNFNGLREILSFLKKHPEVNIHKRIRVL